MSKSMRAFALTVLFAASLSGCASRVISMGDGTYKVGEQKRVAQGGAAKAIAAASDHANQYCAERERGARAAILDTDSRDVFTTTAGRNGSSLDGFSGEVVAAVGTAHFACEGRNGMMRADRAPAREEVSRPIVPPWYNDGRPGSIPGTVGGYN